MARTTFYFDLTFNKYSFKEKFFALLTSIFIVGNGHGTIFI